MRHILFSNNNLLLSHTDLPQMPGSLPTNRIGNDVALITGATGFIGGYLLMELLKNSAFQKIYCIVRPNTDYSGFDRIKANLIAKGMSADLISSVKIIAIDGDILVPQFGIDSQLFSELQESVDHVFHFAATMNWVTPFNKNTIANIEALKTILTFCSTQRLKKLHYASSMGLWALTNPSDGALLENELHKKGDHLPGGYFQLKWIAENILKKVALIGLPTNIYRIGDVKGHSKDGLGDPNNLGNMFMKYFISRGVAIDDDTAQLNYLPVDYITQSIAHISTTRSNKTFQFSNPELISFKDIYKAALELGHDIQLISHQTWKDLLYSDRSAEGKQLKSIFRSFSPDPGESPTSFYDIGMRMFRKSHDTTNTLSALNDTTIECPAMIKDKILHCYLNHISRSTAKV